MPETFDISQSQQQQAGMSAGSGPPTRGTGTAWDDYARNVLYVVLAGMAMVMGYLIWGLFFSNVWSNPGFTNSDGVTQARHLSNIASLQNILLYGSIVGVLCVAICCLRDEGIGYVMAALSAFFYFGLRWLTDSVYNTQGVESSKASEAVIAAFQSIWWVYAVPAGCFIIADVVRRFQAASENAAIQRANIKYGNGVGRQGKSNEKFLGRCWELPYCREHIRPRCPIFIRRRGPCWWYKEGCMCEERIVLQAVISNDWKEQTAAANQRMNLTDSPIKPNVPQSPGAPISGASLGGQSLGGPSLGGPSLGIPPAGSQPRGAGINVNPLQPGQTLSGQKMSVSGAPSPTNPGPQMGLSASAPPRQILTPAAKRERCRKCIIYNEHQRQKYKLAVGLCVAALPVAIFLCWQQLQTIVGGILNWAEGITARISLTPDTTNSVSGMHSEVLQDVLIVCIGLVVISQVLKVVEWAIFKLKI